VEINCKAYVAKEENKLCLSKYREIYFIIIHRSNCFQALIIKIHLLCPRGLKVDYGRSLLRKLEYTFLIISILL
jgi:hypothetical protein